MSSLQYEAGGIWEIPGKWELSHRHPLARTPPGGHAAPRRSSSMAIANSKVNIESQRFISPKVGLPKRITCDAGRIKRKSLARGHQKAPLQALEGFVQRGLHISRDGIAIGIKYWRLPQCGILQRTLLDAETLDLPLHS